MSENTIDLKVLRHSASHVMAQAVKRLFPEVKLAIGPAIEDGFYYDFDLERSLNEDDLKNIKAEMKKIIKEGAEFVHSTMPKDEALEYFSGKGEIYKVELIGELEDDVVSIYTSGDFVDLCKGPHVEKTSRIKAFELLSVAGAYWRGDEKNKMLQRIYGTAFADRAELKEFMFKREEAKKRDHRKLGRELSLFSVQEDSGAGLIFWEAKGTRVRNRIEGLLKDLHYRNGYEFVTTPHIGRVDLWKTSGHFEFYRENMFTPMETDGIEYVIKPMNCPGHILIYKNDIHSYRELPVRMAELGTVYRYERSGVLHGMLRVRGFTQDDAHIFCRPDQIREEIVEVLKMIYLLMDIFGFEVKVFLSTRPEKFVGTEENWEISTTALEDALKDQGIEYVVDPGEGVFYGPKIDFKMLDSLGRTWQGPTIQVDFNLTERFNVEYVDSDGSAKQAVMIHRALLGSLERFFGVLIEHYAGNFPLWLAPEQVRVVPVSEASFDYARKVEKFLKSKKLWVSADLSDDKLGKRIRNAEKDKVPYVLVVGEQEAADSKVAVRKKGEGDKGVMGLEEFFALIEPELNYASDKVDEFIDKNSVI